MEDDSPEDLTSCLSALVILIGLAFVPFSALI